MKKFFLLILLASPIGLAPLSSRASRLDLPEYAPYKEKAAAACLPLARGTLSFDKRLATIKTVVLGFQKDAVDPAWKPIPKETWLVIPAYNQLQGYGVVEDAKARHLFTFRCDLQEDFRKAFRFFYSSFQS